MAKDNNAAQMMQESFYVASFSAAMRLRLRRTLGLLNDGAAGQVGLGTITTYAQYFATKPAQLIWFRYLNFLG